MSEEVVVIDPDATDKDNNNTPDEENEVAADVTRETVVGEPDSNDFRLHGSVVYTHNYFRKIDRTTAICLSCKVSNEANQTKPPRKGESEADKAKRKSFKARHAKNIAKGKTSAAYWANKIKW